MTATTVHRVARVTPARASWLRIKAVARRQAFVLRRSPHRLFDVTVWPLVDTLLFGSLAVYFAREGDGVSGVEAGAGYLLVGIVLWHVVYQAQIAVATGFLEETWSRNLLSLMVTPIKEMEYVAGVALFGLVKLSLGVGAVAVAAFGFYAFDVTDLGLALLPVIAVLLVAGWSVAMFVIGLVLRFGTGAEALAWGILFVVMPLSGTFYPVSALPGFLQPVSRLLPTTHAFAAGRALIDGEATPWHELTLAALTTFLLTAAALVFVAAMLRVFRRRGYITRYS
ncbi:MAG TPA: ABC transporter permease [Mycobacteriales bacterium]|nr:ABC transporter permease [Mycobacteriales bacterium]